MGEEEDTNVVITEDQKGRKTKDVKNPTVQYRQENVVNAVSKTDLCLIEDKKIL